MPRIPVTELAITDLLVDAIYEGRKQGNAGDDPLPSLIGVGNQGGFRIKGSHQAPTLVALTSSFSSRDWPDHLDRETGIFTYYGDNKEAGTALLDTPRKGNRLLEQVFERLHAGPRRREIPPILVFGPAPGSHRDLMFLGLAVPGVQGMRPTEDLVAVWKVTDELRFQNYRAYFTILNVPTVSRAWLKDIRNGNPFSANCPEAWRKWAEFGVYEPLQTTRTTQHRTKAQQLPASDDAWAMLRSITSHFASDPYAFEPCAAMLAQMMDPNFAAFDVTRRMRDGGRDAIGLYRIGLGEASILVDCALEAKCYGEKSSVGVKEASRLISRLRHRQFGILVTTSYVHEQAYKEIQEDKHPVIIMSGRDTVDVLDRSGLKGTEALGSWLQSNFPLSTA